MGYTVLYIAFGVVALWLLGEVLLQYKAQLRWRGLAFIGFMGVVGGVYLRTVTVIALGAAAFAVGQTFVTVSYRRGFSTGWALGGGPGSSKRRRVGSTAQSQPTLEVSEIEPVEDGYQEPPPQPVQQPQPVYQPQPMAEDTAEYAAYSTSSYAADPYPAPDPLAGSGYDGYGGGWDSGGYQAYAQPQRGGDVYTAAAEGTQYQQQGLYEDPDTAAGAAPGAPPGTDPGQYPSYQDPYQDPYQASYQDPYATDGYADPYADPYRGTPPGGVWVPQQQTGEPYVPPAAPDPASGYDPYRY